MRRVAFSSGNAVGGDGQVLDEGAAAPDTAAAAASSSSPSRGTTRGALTPLPAAPGPSVWGIRGAQWASGAVRDALVVTANGGPDLLVYFAGLGRGSGTGFTTTALLDTPGAARSLCKRSAVAGLDGMTWGSAASIECGGNLFTGVEVTAPIQFAYATGDNIALDRWGMALGEQTFVALADTEFDSIIGDVGRTDVVALLGVDWGRARAFHALHGALVAAFHDPTAPVAATHVLRSSRLGLDDMRGSQARPTPVLLHPLAEHPVDAPGMVPLRGGGDRQLHADDGRPHPHPVDWDARSDRAYQALRHDGPDLGLDPALAARLGEFMSLDEHARPTVVPVNIKWNNADEMFADVRARARMGTSDPAALQQLKDILWHRREAFGDMAPRKMDSLRLQLLPGALPSQEGLSRFLLPWQALEVARAMDEFVANSVAEEVTCTTHRQRLNILPIVLVQKPGGRGWRFCLDFRSLNRKLAKHVKHLLPDLGCIVQDFAGCEMFSVLDEPKAFNQVRACDESADWMACSFIDPRCNERRFFRMRGAMLGLEPLSALYQEGSERVMNAVHARTSEVGRVMIDDFALGSRRGQGSRADMLQRHLKALDTLLEAQIDRGHVFDLGKCQFLVREARMLGVITDGTATRVDPDRMSGWEHMKVPPVPTLKWLSSLMGTLIYAAPRMGPTYQRVSAPLWDLLGDAERVQRDGELTKDRDKVRLAQRLLGRWDAVHAAATDECVRLALENSIQLYFKSGAPCWVTADASDKGFCAYLQQEGADGLPKIVCIISRRFTMNQRLWSVGARELYALLEFMRRWGHLLAFASHVTFNTDHLNLLMAEDLENAYVRRWLMELFQWPAFGHMVHLPGRCNQLADFLSRWSISETDIPPAGAALPGDAELDDTPAWVKARRAAAAASSSAPPSDSEDLPQGHGIRRVRAPATDAQAAPPVDRPAPRRAARAAAAALAGAPAPSEAILFDNPHRSELSELINAILEAQRGLTELEQRNMLGIMGVERKSLEGEDLFLRRGKLVVPPTVPAVVAMVCSLLHDSALHSKSGKMLDMLNTAGLFLPGASAIFEHYCATCSQCIRANAPDAPVPQHGRLLIRPRSEPWQHVFMDYASLPETAKGYSKVIIMVEAALRICMLVPVKDEDGATSAAALHEWRKVYPGPSMVHTDGGPAFKAAFIDYCATARIGLDRGTAYNSRGRGLVERLVKKVKDALRRVLPTGRLDDWVDALGDVQILLNRLPHAGLGGLSPQQLGMLAVEPLFPHAFKGKALDPQAWEDLMDGLRYARAITEICGEVDEVKRKLAYDAATTVFPVRLGDWFLVYHNERDNSLQSFFRGPFQVTDEGSGGFCTVAPVLAGDKLGNERLQVHVGRLWPFNAERTSSDLEHQKRLPAGYGVVKAITAHRQHALGVQVQVQWLMLEKPTWEFVAAMRERGVGYNAVYKEYCTANGLRLVDGVSAH